MKALEVLKKVSVFSEHSKHYPSFDDFNEAIKELEALESRNCEGCKHLEIFRQRKGAIGAYCPYFGNCKEEAHLESYWEAKQ